MCLCVHAELKPLVLFFFLFSGSGWHFFKELLPSQDGNVFLESHHCVENCLIQVCDWTW